MKFNLAKFAKNKSDLTKFGMNILGQETFEIYSLKRGARYPRQLILPKELILDTKLSELIGLYVGDGDLNAKSSSHTSFISIDDDLVSFVYKAFKEKFGIGREKMTLMINHSTNDQNFLNQKWSKILDTDDFKFRKSIRSTHDALLIQINSKIFSVLFREFIYHILPFIQNNKGLRKGFLRGYFSADGGIGVKKDPTRLNLSQLTFNYNTKTEKWLRNFVIKCLKLEKIENVSYTEYGSEGYMSVYNWKNYLKLWKIGIFDGNHRKKSKFLQVVKEMQIYLNLENTFRENIFKQTGLKQKEIAGILNSWQGNVSKTIRGVHLLNIEQMNTLIKHTDNSWDNIFENSINIRIGSKTFLPVDYDFLKLALSNKNLI